MPLLEDIKKWFKAPKTRMGLVGLAVIIVILALDFAYWAGAIDVSSLFGENGEEGEEVTDIEVPEDFDSGEIAGSLEHGRKMYAFQQLMDDPRGEGEGETYNLYPFEVEANISKILVESDGDGGRPRIDGGDRNDIDLYLYKPGNDAEGDFESTSPDYEGATPYITESIQVKKKTAPFGNWTLRVDCYTGDGVQYTVRIQVFYDGGNATEEEE